MITIREDIQETHTFSLLVDNEAGVLARVIGLFSGRGYNIESLTVAEVDKDSHTSRITIVSKGSPKTIDQIKRHLERLVPVHKVTDLTIEGPSVEREMALIKVLNKSEVISKIEKNYSSLEFNELDNKDEKTILRLIGDTDNLESLLVELEDDLIEVTRTGALGMTLGNVSLETEEETKVIY